MLILVQFWHLLFILFFFGPVKLLGGFDGQNWNKKWVNEKCRCRILEKKKLHIQHYIFCMFFCMVRYCFIQQNPHVKRTLRRVLCDMGTSALFRWLTMLAHL